MYVLISLVISIIYSPPQVSVCIDVCMCMCVYPCVCRCVHVCVCVCLYRCVHVFSMDVLISLVISIIYSPPQVSVC